MCGTDSSTVTNSTEIFHECTTTPLPLASQPAAEHGAPAKGCLLADVTIRIMLELVEDWNEANISMELTLDIFQLGEPFSTISKVTNQRLGSPRRRLIDTNAAAHMNDVG